MNYKEEKELVIRLSFSAEFDETYEGDDDGYVWYQDFDERVRPQILRELTRLLTSEGHFKITPVNRGLDSHEELELKVERVAHSPLERGSRVGPARSLE